jgi:hypothetical protein
MMLFCKGSLRSIKEKVFQDHETPKGKVVRSNRIRGTIKFDELQARQLKFGRMSPEFPKEFPKVDAFLFPPAG